MRFFPEIWFHLPGERALIIDISSNSVKNIGLLIFRIFSLFGWSSKYDFWNPWQILDRPRCSKKILIFFRGEKNFSKNMFWENFENFLKIFEKSQNSIGISMIPFITRYKGNHRNPYRILRFFKNFQKIFKIFPKHIF